MPQLRLRRVSVHLWTFECATHTGRFEPAFLCDQLDQVMSEVATTMPWVLAPPAILPNMARERVEERIVARR